MASLTALRPGAEAGARAGTGSAVLMAGRELVLVLGLYLGYRLGRILMVGHEAKALANADLVHRVQAALHLPLEAVLQADLGSHELFRLANTYYVWVHFPVTITFLVLGTCGSRRNAIAGPAPCWSCRPVWPWPSRSPSRWRHRECSRNGALSTP